MGCMAFSHFGMLEFLNLKKCQAKRPDKCATLDHNKGFQDPSYTSDTSVSSQTHIPSRVYVRTVWSDDQIQHLAGSDMSLQPWISQSHLQWAGRI